MDRLPVNAAAERALLGIVINHNQALFEIGALDKTDFRAEEANGELFILLKDQIEAGRAVTADTLLHDAQDAVIWDDNVRASDYLHKLEREAPADHSLIKELARTVRDTALRAKMVEAADDLKKRVMAAPVSITAQELRTEYDEAFATLFAGVDDLGIRQMGDVTDAVLARLQKPADSMAGYSPGLAMVQELIGALLPGRLYILGGAPGSGKSALVSQICRSVAMAGVPSLLFSPEMEDEEQAGRLMAADTGVRPDSIERGLINNAEYEQLWQANEKVKHIPFYIDAYSAPTLSMIRGRSMRKKKLGGLGVVAVDHGLYMGRPDRKMNEIEAVSDNLTGLKMMAKDLQIAVVVLWQFSAEALRRMAVWPHPKPTQGDLLYTSTCDRNSDAILLLHRDEYFLRRAEPEKDDKNRMDWDSRLLNAIDQAELILTKRRGGRGYGSRVAWFDAERLTFHDNRFRVAPGSNAPDLLTRVPI